MKRSFMVAVALSVGLTAVSAADKSVTVEKVLDINNATPELANGGTYVPVADKFLSVHPSTVRLYNGTTGAYENDLPITGITPSGAGGFHAATATEDGHIYIIEDGAKDIWRWTSVTDTAPVKVYDTAEKYWFGYTATIGDDISVGFSNPVTSGPVAFFSDSFPFTASSFSFTESAELKSKMGLAFNKDVSMAWTVADTDALQPLLKFTRIAGSWIQDPVWQTPHGNPARPTFYDQGGPMAYDNENDLLFVLGMQLYNKKLSVYDGTTGELITTDTLTNEPFTPTRGGGAWVESDAEGGTVSFAARAPGNSTSTQTGINLYRWNYTVSTTSGVDDWNLF